MKPKLTPTRIRRLKFNPNGPAKQVESDRLLPAFGVRVYPTGRKSYVLRYGTTRRMVTLGPCTTADDLDEMREQAHDILREYNAHGDDPKAAKRRAGLHTVETVVSDYIEARSKGRDKWAAGEKKRAEGRLKLYIAPAIGGAAITALTRAECKKMHRKIKAGYQANRTLQLLHAAIEWAIGEGIVRAIDLAEAENPAKRIKRNPEKSRREWIRPDELPAVWEAIRTEGNPWTQAFFRMLFFTGARKSELLNLTWQDVDVKHGRLTFRDTKNRTDHALPLAPDAVAILKALPRTINNPYVFCGRHEGKPLNNPYKAWRRILKAAGIERRITLHDVRRTVGSTLASEGYSTQQVGKLLGHKSAITARVYAEIADESKQEMTDAMAGMLK